MTDIKDNEKVLVSNRIKDEFLASVKLVGRVADPAGTFAPILNYTNGTANFTDYTCKFTSKTSSPLAKRGLEFNGDNYAIRDMSLSYVVFVADYMRMNGDGNYNQYLDGATNRLMVELGQAKRMFAMSQDQQEKSKYEFKMEGLNKTLQALSRIKDDEPVQE